MSLTVMEVPGHTLGHIAFHDANHCWLFCGDTLFAGGCGRLFEGTPAQMFDSLQRLASLPAKTQVFCTHEYTLANLTFAAAVTPDDDAVAQRLNAVRQARETGQITLPSTLEEETRSNPFLRAHEPALKHACDSRCRDGGRRGDLTVEQQRVLRSVYYAKHLGSRAGDVLHDLLARERRAALGAKT